MIYLGIIVFLAVSWGWIAVEMFRAQDFDEDEETVI
jgi:hypothetical protein